MNTLRGDIIPYRDSCGLILPKKWEGTPRETGNGLLYLGIFYLLLDDVNEEDEKKFTEIVRSCYEQTGLLNRNPGQNDNLNGHDDYIGVCAASLKLNSPVGLEIYDYGKAHNWCYNNVEPSKFTLRSWFARMPWNITHITRCAKKSLFFPIEIVEKLTTIIGISSEASSNILTWCRLKSTDGWVWNIIKRIWTYRINKKYGSIQGLFAEYFGLDHPLVKYVKTDIQA